jgi:predicted ArsR family transcriptional regulator
MPTDPSAVTAIAALGEPVRRRLYDVVVAAAEPIGREQAASLAGVASHTARFHLDRLVDEGLLDIEFRRLTGRTGPGSGRPAKLYRRGPGELTVSIPARDYDLLSRILANAVAMASESAAPVAEIATAVARSEGTSFGAAHGADGDELDRVTGALAAGGYEPRRQEDEVRVHNCPFHRAAQEQATLVCSLNLAYVAGICAGLECTSLTPALEPSPGSCCVVVRGS